MVTKKITEGGEGLLEMYGEQCGHAGRYWRCPICERAAISQAVSEAVRAERERCAKIADKFTYFGGYIAQQIAEALRAEAEGGQ